MPGRAVDGRKRPGGQPERSTTRTLTDQTRIAAIVADDGDSVLVDLDDHRMRRLLADLDLAPTVPVPCSGCCRCYGTPIGAECRP
jgi:hypothetical protein